MTGVVVRRAVAGDAAAMAAILNPLIAEGTTTAMAGVQRAADWRALAAGEVARSACFVAEVEGRVVGFQYVEPSPLAPDTDCAIASFVAMGLGRGGIGKALFASVAPAARALGFARIGATIRADNLGGLAFYTRVGFIDDRVFRAEPLADGRPMDRIRKVFALQ